MIKFLKSHIHKNPDYVYKTSAFDLKIYDRLYENWHRPDHKTWIDLQAQNDIKIIKRFQNRDSYLHDGKDEKIGFIFFKDRTDRRHLQINFSNTSVDYLPNTLLILHKSYPINFSKAESDMPDKPFVVIEIGKSLLECINKFF